MGTGHNSSSQAPISLATSRQMYNLDDIEHRLGKLTGSRSDLALRDVYDRMLNRGPNRFSVRPSRTPDMDNLYKELPNFGPALDAIKRQVALCEDSEDGLDITPLFLLGEPGVGKTHFAKKIAKLIGTGFGMIPMSQMTAGWILSGSSPQWEGAKPGKVFEYLVDGHYANPVLVVDEADKASSASRYDPLGSLYTLFEHDTAQSFSDEYVGVPIDARGIIWIVTANDGDAIPDPIKNRMDTFVINKPTREQARIIAGNLYTSIRAEHLWGNAFELEPTDDTLDALAKIGPREMRSALKTGFGNAKLSKSTQIRPEHLPKPENDGPGMGFMTR